MEEGLPVMEIDISPYVQQINWDLFDTDERNKGSSAGSINQGLTRKRKRANDDEEGPEAKKMRQISSPTDGEELRKNLCYPDEGPSRWGGCVKEKEVIDLTTSDSEMEEDDDDSFIDDEDDEDNDGNDDGDDNDEYEIKVDPIYCLRGRALCKWDLDFWRVL